MATPTNAPKLKRRLTTQDASFLYAESLSGPVHIGMLSILDGRLQFDQLVKHIRERLHLLPRYRQRLVFAPFNLAHATLEDDPGFRLENHVKRHSLPEGTSEAEMLEAATRVFEPPLDRSRPLWEAHAFEGVEGGRTGLLWKIHHCLVDGVSWVELTTVLFDADSDSPPPPSAGQAWSPAPLPGPGETFRSAAEDLAQARAGAQRLAQELSQNPEELAQRTRRLEEAARTLSETFARPIVPAPWNAGVVTQRRSFTWARYPFDDVRAIRKALGGTVNDVVLATLSEGAARYLEHHGCRTDGLPLRIGCPVSIRREDERGTLGNRVSMMFPELPATPMAPVERLAAVKNETERIKSARIAESLALLMESWNMMPPSQSALNALYSSARLDSAAMWAAFTPMPAPSQRPSAPTFGINFVATNIPGVQAPQYLAGNQCRDNIVLLPIGGNAGYGVAILSYNGNLYFGMIAEPRLMPDVELMKSLVDRSFNELRDAASKAR